MARRTKSAILIVVVLVGGFFVWQKFIRGQIRLPKGETMTEIIVVKEVGEEQGQTKTIMVTDNVKHSIPLTEIRSGGPPKDGIPSIDAPKFISPSEASAWLDDSDPGIAFSRGNTHRFYPYQILVWHEIVNDTVEGERVLVSYCPLCLTGFVFDPLVKNERVAFGTSGKLWKSNLVMYDRKTDSLWSQILGEAILGEATGTKLQLLPSDQVRFGDWRAAHPDGQVLSRDTGATRFYGSNPYGGYFSVTNLALSLAGNRDTRLPNDALIFGIVVNDHAKAYHIDAVRQKGEVVDEFQGKQFVLKHDQKLDAVRVYERLPDGNEARINPFSSFWFSWAVAHPETELFK